MPSKHIEANLWRKVEKKTVEAVISTKQSIKDTTMLKWLIMIGLKEIKERDIKLFLDNELDDVGRYKRFMEKGIKDTHLEEYEQK